MTDPIPLDGESATITVPAEANWVAGWNLPGYLPESDPEAFTEWQDAHGHLVDAVDRFWDEDAATPDLDEDAVWLPLHTALNSATYGEPFQGFNGDQRLVFWIQPVE